MTRFNRQRLAVPGIALALACMLLAGAYWWTRGRFMIGTDNAYVRADVVTVSARVAGTVAMVAVADNQTVHAGDLLARIDDRDYRMQVTQAEGALTAARAAVDAQRERIANLDARTAQQRDLIAADRAAADARAADARLAGIEARRQADLARQDVNSLQELQTAQAADRRAGAGLAQARATLSASQRQLPVFATERAAALAELARLNGLLQASRSALDAARLDLERTAIRAPVAGIVGQRSVRAGQYAETGAPLLAVVPVEAYVVANYKETQAARIRPGQPVRIRVDAFDGAVLSGHVDSFAPASGAEFALLPPDNATGNFTKIVQRLPLRIRLDPGQARSTGLRPGMSVETTVDTRDGRR